MKSPEQLAVLAVHRNRELLRRQKVATSNHILGLLGEFGVVTFTNMLALLRADDVQVNEALAPLPVLARDLVKGSIKNLNIIANEERLVEKMVRAWHASSRDSQRAATVPGVGFLTATALAASFNRDAHASGRQFSASLGLVPVQHSTGGIPRLGHIGKGGDAYLRRLLVTAAFSSIMRAHRDCRAPACLVDLLKRKSTMVTACAHANRLARTTWSVMASGEEFDGRKQWRVVEYFPPAKRKIDDLEGAE